MLYFGYQCRIYHISSSHAKETAANKQINKQYEETIKLLLNKVKYIKDTEEKQSNVIVIFPVISRIFKIDVRNLIALESDHYNSVIPF